MNSITVPQHVKTAICSVLFVPLALIASSSQAAESPKPNIIVILVDDMGWSDIGSYGSEISTPNLDRLAKEGVRFTQFYNTGRCCPTRASLLTGLYSHQAGVGHMTDERKSADGKPLPGYSGRLNDRCVTMAEVLKPAGYFTAMSGKWHVGQNLGVVPWERGFDRSLNAAAGGFFFHDSPRTRLFLNGKDVGRNDDPLPKEWYSTDLWTEYGLKFIDEAREAKKPFFLYLAHNAPHFPLQAPEADIARWRGKFKAGWDQLREARYKRQIEMGLIDKAWPLSPRAKEVPAWESLSAEDQDRYDHIMAIYAAVMERMDKAIGDLVAGLEKRGELDNTLILFMSDNGGNAEAGVQGRLRGENPGDAKSDVFVGESWATLNNTPFVRYKHYNDEGGIATPLIAYWPKGISEERRGKLEHQPGHLIDIMATVVDVGGATYPKDHKSMHVQPMEGVTLRPAFEGKPLARTSPLFWEHESNRAVREGDWKLVAVGDQPWRLYNLATDRTEQNDLIKAEPERAKDLEAKWNAWATRANVLPLGGWRGTSEGKKKGLSKKLKFTLRGGDHLDREQAPAIANRAFTVKAKFNATGGSGVLLAQGGSAHGYALFLKEGKLVWTVRAGKEATSLESSSVTTGTHEMTARIDADGTMSLALDDQPPVTTKAPGPIIKMPQDGLDVGSDEGGLVGDYGESNRFAGSIENVVIELANR